MNNMGKRLGIGETGKFGEKRSKSSKRSEEGDISVIKKTCPFCHHHKVFGYISGRYKCCKCGKEIKFN